MALKARERGLQELADTATGLAEKLKGAEEAAGELYEQWKRCVYACIRIVGEGLYNVVLHIMYRTRKVKAGI